MAGTEVTVDSATVVALRNQIESSASRANAGNRVRSTAPLEPSRLEVESWSNTIITTDFGLAPSIRTDRCTSATDERIPVEARFQTKSVAITSTAGDAMVMLSRTAK